MKIILTENVKNLGEKGELVQASDGYARNFLFPRDLAIEATEENLKIWEADQAEKAAQEKERKEEASKIKDQLEKTKITILAKGGDGGRLFGAITNKDIEKAIKDQVKVAIDRKKIELKENIKQAGVHTVEVRVYPEMIAKLRVDVQTQD